MRPENEARLGRIERISKVLRWVCKVFLVLCVLRFLIMAGIVVLSAVQGHGFIWGDSNVVQYQLTVGGEAVICVYYTLLWVAAFLCVFYLHRLLDNYSRGEIFTGDSARQIRRWGLACVLWGVMGFLWNMVPGTVFTHPLPISSHSSIADYAHTAKPEPGDWSNGKFVQPHGGGMMVNGLMIVAISWFMAMAAEMREENELTV
jgi:hypothetical protein